LRREYLQKQVAALAGRVRMRVASIKKDTEEKNNFGRERRRARA
jgi:hypothetical protein